MLASHAAVAAACLTVGWLAGAAWEKAARGWRDYRTHKAQLPALLALARTLTARAVGFGVLAATVAALALYALAQRGS